MARVADTQGGDHNALYAALLVREEAEAALNCPWPRPGPTARLAALRAGKPATVYAGSLPSWARDGLGVRVTALTYVQVSADGTVVLVDADDGSRLFTEEHGL